MNKQSFLEICASQYDELEKLDQAKGFYEYEKEFAKIMTELNRKLFESKISEIPGDRRKKKLFAATAKSK